MSITDKNAANAAEVLANSSTVQRPRCLQPRWSGFHAGDVTGTDTPPKEIDQ